MPCLGRDILFDIGKELVQNGEPNDFIKFSISGKESLNAATRVFGSVTALKLFKNSYSIGWDKNCCTFKFQLNVLPLKRLFNQIGNRVTKLHIHNYITFVRIPYQAVLRKIIISKRLTAFSCADTYASRSFVDEFLPYFCGTLKNVCIPGTHMTELFRDTFELDSLTVLSSYNVALFCCKTFTLKINKNTYEFLRSFSNQRSPFLSSVKHIVFNDAKLLCFYYYYFDVLEYFTSVEDLQYNKILSGNSLDDIKRDILSIIDDFTFFIKKAIKIPSKTICYLFKPNKSLVFNDLCEYKNICNDFELIETKPKSTFYCFQKNIQSAHSQSTTTFELRISK